MTTRSLHPCRGQPAPPGDHTQPLPKPDRLLVGLLAGAALFYMLGRALGLGRHRTDHVGP